MKILMIGLGGIGQRHVRNLRHLLGDDAELLAYRRRGLAQVITPGLDADTSRDVATEYNVRVFTDLEAALAQKPDVAFITNPSSLHVEVATACALAGCDLFIEKPLSNSTEGIQRLIAAVAERDRVAMVGYQLRFHPCFLRLAEIVASGELGALLAVEAMIGEYLPGWHRYEDYRQMYASRSDLGGGVVLSQIHEFDYLYALFGRPKRVFALGGHWSGLEIDVEDVSSALMEFSFGTRPLPVHLHQDFLQRPPSRRCEVIGESGRAILDFVQLTVTEQIGAREAKVSSFAGFDRNDLFVDELKHFLDCVRTRATPLVSLQDGLASLEMALAVKQSIESGQVVALDDLRKKSYVA